MTPTAPLKTVLCVDDTPTNLKILNESLKGDYKVMLANSGQKALDLLSQPENLHQIKMVLLDVMMPDMDGYEVCERLRSQPETEHLPIIFITAQSSPLDEQKALQVGGNDFISKPINLEVLLSRIETHLKLEEYQSFLRERNTQLENTLSQSLLDIFRLQEATMSVMSSLAEFRDEETGHHIKRTQLYIKLLADCAAQHYPDLSLDKEMISLISKCAPLHDIGKITTPDHILLKPGSLEPEEFEIMKQHTVKGYNILQNAAHMMGSHGDFLRVAQELAISHHERWDGTGYPHRLSGEHIPLSGRLMAIVDVYDALRSKRVYKPSFSHEKSMAIIQEGRGSHFDPRLVDCFVTLESQIHQLSEQWKDAVT